MERFLKKNPNVTVKYLLFKIKKLLIKIIIFIINRNNKLKNNF